MSLECKECEHCYLVWCYCTASFLFVSFLSCSPFFNFPFLELSLYIYFLFSLFLFLDLFFFYSFSFCFFCLPSLPFTSFGLYFYFLSFFLFNFLHVFLFLCFLIFFTSHSPLFSSHPSLFVQADSLYSCCVSYINTPLCVNSRQDIRDWKSFLCGGLCVTVSEHRESCERRCWMRF